MDTFLIIIGIFLLIRQLLIGDGYSGPQIHSDRMNYPNFFKKAMKNENKKYKDE